MAKLNSFRELRVEEGRWKVEGWKCDKMLERLSEWRGTTRTGYEVREEAGRYGTREQPDERESLARISAEVMAEFEPSTFHPAPST